MLCCRWCCAVHATCSGRGICGTDTGVCDCFNQFSGSNCGVTGVVWSSTTVDILLLHSEMDTYSGNLLHLKTERPPSKDFYHLVMESDDEKTFTMRGDGYTVLYKVSTWLLPKQDPGSGTSLIRGAYASVWAGRVGHPEWWTDHPDGRAGDCLWRADHLQ